MALRINFAYNVAINTTSTAGARVTPFGISVVRVAATADCYIVIGASPVATVAAGTLVRAGVTNECFNIGAGESVACISGTAGGTLNVTELTN